MVVGNAPDKDCTLTLTLKHDVRKLLDAYGFPADTQENVPFQDTFELTDAQTGKQVDLAAKVNSLLCYYVKVLSTGAKIAVAPRRSGGNAPVMADAGNVLGAENGLMLVVWNSAETPPILYIDNLEASDQVVVEVGGIGSSVNT